jgi:hypothetical protein
VTKGGWCMGHGKLPHEHCRWALCDCECHTDKGSRLERAGQGADNTPTGSDPARLGNSEEQG